MNNIRSITDSIKAEIKVDANGNATLTMRGTSRLLNLGSNQLSHHYMAATLIQTLTEYGFDPASFNEKGIPDVALGLIANYYAYESKATNDQAKQVAQFLSAMGARAALRQVAGWKPVAQTYAESLRELADKVEKEEKIRSYFDALPLAGFAYDRAVTVDSTVLTPAIEHMSVKQILNHYCVSLKRGKLHNRFYIHLMVTCQANGLSIDTEHQAITEGKFKQSILTCTGYDTRILPYAETWFEENGIGFTTPREESLY